MLQVTGEVSVHLLTAIWYGAFVLGVVLIAFTRYAGRKDVNGMNDNRLTQEEHRMNRRRVKGGVYFNELLWDLKGEEERRMRQLLARMAEPDVTPEDRRVYSEQITV